MANHQMKSVASLLLVLNFCMNVMVLGLGGWPMNRAIDHGFIIGPGLELPAHFSPIYFPMGNAATGFFETFALIAGVVGIASVISGLNHIRSWALESLPSAASVAAIAWSLNLLATGFGCKEIELHIKHACLITMEAFLTIIWHVTRVKTSLKVVTYIYIWCGLISSFNTFSMEIVQELVRYGVIYLI